jgi:sec-independent protein translocase protein TatB
MFDIGFSELLLIGVIALLVIGPERLPKVARTAGMWVGRARRFVNSVRRDIEQEINAEEIKKNLEAHKASNPVHEIIEDTKQSFVDIKKETDAVADTAKAAGQPKDKAKDQEGKDKSDQDSADR